MGKEVLSGFSKAQLQNFRTIIWVLRKAEMTVEEAITYIDGITTPRFGAHGTKLCPECKSPMRLFAVNFSKATRVPGDFKSQWQCMNKECLYDIFSKATPQEEVLKLTRGMTNGNR